jgi:hypothetical protein
MTLDLALGTKKGIRYLFRSACVEIQRIVGATFAVSSSLVLPHGTTTVALVSIQIVAL